MQSVEVVRAWHSIKKVLTSDFQKEIIFSDESLVGDVYGGNFLQEFEDSMDRVGRIFDRPKIMFGIRKQSSYVFSLYKQYLHEGGYKGIEHFFNKDDTGVIRHQDLYYKPRMDMLRETFGDVFFYSQETLLERPQDFLDELVKFLEIDEKLRVEDLRNERFNVGVRTNLQVKVLKSLNRFEAFLQKLKIIPSLYSWPVKKMRLTPRHIAQDHLRRIKGNKFEMDAELKAHIDATFEEDWKAAVGELSY